jgi:hypothetical protein
MQASRVAFFKSDSAERLPRIMVSSPKIHNSYQRFLPHPSGGALQPPP